MIEPHQRPEWIFRYEWTYCACHGHCDALDSTEYRRVLREWLAAGQPERIRLFIRRRANIDSQGREASV